MLKYEGCLRQNKLSDFFRSQLEMSTWLLSVWPTVWSEVEKIFKRKTDFFFQKDRQLLKQLDHENRPHHLSVCYVCMKVQIRKREMRIKMKEKQNSSVCCSSVAVWNQQTKM